MSGHDLGLAVAWVIAVLGAIPAAATVVLILYGTARSFARNRLH